MPLANEGMKQTMTTLESQLTEFKTDFFQQAPPAATEVIQNWVGELSASGIEEHSLKVGQKAPDFTLPNVHGQPVHLADLLAHGPVVLMFYRGAWCPFCNLALRAYQKALPQIQAAGARLVAISPMTPDNSLSLAEKAELGYEVLSDQGNTVARQFGLVYRLGDAMYALQEQLGIDLTQANGDDSHELPLPGTFVIAQDGTIRFAQVFADHAQRAEPSVVLAALR